MHGTAETISFPWPTPPEPGKVVDLAPGLKWLRLALPFQLLCRPDCKGLCPVCGVSLNDADPAEHEHGAEPDPRWAKLRELKLDP